MCLIRYIKIVLHQEDAPELRNGSAHLGAGLLTQVSFKQLHLCGTQGKTLESQLKMQGRGEETAQWVKGLLCQHEDRSFYPQHLYKSQTL